MHDAARCPVGHTSGRHWLASGLRIVELSLDAAAAVKAGTKSPPTAPQGWHCAILQRVKPSWAAWESFAARGAEEPPLTKPSTREHLRWHSSCGHLTAPHSSLWVRLLCPCPYNAGLALPAQPASVCLSITSENVRSLENQIRT